MCMNKADLKQRWGASYHGVRRQASPLNNACVEDAPLLISQIS